MRFLDVARFFVAAIVLASCGKSAAPPTTSLPQLPIIPEVKSVNGVASLTLQAAFDGNGRPGFFWNGQHVAPTLRVQPGDTIQIHFVNDLPQYCAVGVVSNANLHFHGLTTSPNAPGDEVISTNAAPSSAVDYTIQINPDQPPGLYWYHPHAHGLSSWEVGNGMAGAIVVEGIANEVPETAGLTEHVIILGDLPTDPSFAAGERVTDQSHLRGKQMLPGSACRAEVRAAPTINGLPLVTISINPGELQLFRVLNASSHRHFDLALDNQQTLQLVAQDGVPIHDYPGGPESLTVNDILIPPGGRAEFIVAGPSQPASLISECYETGSSFNPNPQAVLALLSKPPSQVVATQAVHVRAATGLRRSKFYRMALPAPTVKRTISFQEDSNGVFSLNNVAYNPSAPPSITAQSGTVEEWSLENDTDEVHTFHIHQVHFVVESVAGITQQNPHWVDSFNIPPQTYSTSGVPIPSITKVLIDFRDPVIRGTFLFHCHILEHEDAGMMAKIQVL